jgi:fluoride ion exporter CrcB/FEX
MIVPQSSRAVAGGWGFLTCDGDYSSMPYRTLGINLTGSFLVGLVLALLTAKRDLSPSWRYLISLDSSEVTQLSRLRSERLRALQKDEIALVLLMWNYAYVLACSQCGEGRV